MSRTDLQPSTFVHGTPDEMAGVPDESHLRL